jgi:hypothetical protein
MLLDAGTPEVTRLLGSSPIITSGIRKRRAMALTLLARLQELSVLVGHAQLLPLHAFFEDERLAGVSGPE